MLLNHRPDVIVNAICPGIVKTDITRDAGTVASIFVNVLGKSPEYGARALITAGLTTEAEHVSDYTGVKRIFDSPDH
jgi:NAD(P)-dependent dehydrogenase (short-subunit alcohol dehydrogenase family)